MRIAFVSCNAEKFPQPVPPLGLLSVMKSTPEGHPRELWDLCFDDAPRESVLRRLAAFAPDLVALGLRNLEAGDGKDPGAGVRLGAEVISVVRSRSRAPILLGGSGFSILPEALMRRLRPDFGIAGEGEGAFPALVSALAAGGTGLSSVPGLFRFEGGTLIRNPPAPGFLDFAALPAPDHTAADPRYFERGAALGVQTKRGCPMGCDYCAYPLIEGRAVRLRDPAAVLDDIETALRERPDARHLFVVDSAFNVDPAHAKAVCREMIRREFRTPWSCYITPARFDRELAGLLAEASCAGVEIGSDSGCDEVLDRLRKGFHRDAILETGRLCAESEIPDCHSFILGTPGETADELHGTLDFIIRLDPAAAILMFWTDPKEALDPSAAEEARSRQTPLREAVRSRRSDFPRWIVPALGMNFDAEAYRTLQTPRTRGPLWRYLLYQGPSGA